MSRVAVHRQETRLRRRLGKKGLRRRRFLRLGAAFFGQGWRQRVLDPVAPPPDHHLRRMVQEPVDDRPGRRTAFTVCQAMSIDMTVVLPAPLANFRARRFS